MQPSLIPLYFHICVKCREKRAIVPPVKLAPLLLRHAGSSVSSPLSLRKKQSLSYRVKARVPFQHKTPTMQLSTPTDFPFRSPPPTHSPHNINPISSFSSLAISNCFHFSTTLIFDWRPTSFCCVRAKCWIGISPQRAFKWHITFFSGRVGGLQPAGSTVCVTLLAIHLIVFLCFDNVTPFRLLNVTVFFQQREIHMLVKRFRRLQPNTIQTKIWKNYLFVI